MFLWMDMTWVMFYHPRERDDRIQQAARNKGEGSLLPKRQSATPGPWGVHFLEYFTMFRVPLFGHMPHLLYDV